MFFTVLRGEASHCPRLPPRPPLTARGGTFKLLLVVNGTVFCNGTWSGAWLKEASGHAAPGHLPYSGGAFDARRRPVSFLTAITPLVGEPCRGGGFGSPLGRCAFAFYSFRLGASVESKIALCSDLNAMCMVPGLSAVTSSVAGRVGRALSRRAHFASGTASWILRCGP